MRRGRDAAGCAFRLSRPPLPRRVHPWTRPEGTDMRRLPINRDIEAPGGLPLSPSILDRWIDEASRRVILDHRCCRKASGCGDCPADTGCLLLGDAAPRAALSISREMGAEEARERARRAMGAGLVPAAGTAREDNLILDVEKTRRMLNRMPLLRALPPGALPAPPPADKMRVFRAGRADLWLYRRQIFPPELTAKPEAYSPDSWAGFFSFRRRTA